MQAPPNPALRPSDAPAPNIPVNGPLRESPAPPKPENGPIHEVTLPPANPHFRESRSTPPRKRPNAERRSREFLTPAEVQQLLAAAQSLGRLRHRDGTMILIAYRHALRVSELTALRWNQVDLAQGLLHVRRLKNGNPSTHPLQGRELRALRRLQRGYPSSPYIFTGERKGPRRPFALVSTDAKIEACGY